jgi:prepilin-type N-terminal cleavage/methylation domain-containing protein
MKKGFTFIEIVVVAAISSVVAMGVSLVATSTRSTWHSSDTLIQLQQELRKAMSSITDDLRGTAVTKIYTNSSLAQAFPNNGVPYSSITFFINQGVDVSGDIIWSTTPVSYALSSNQIIRTYSGSSKVVANNINSLSFIRQPSVPNVITINMGAQKTTIAGQALSATLDTELAVRN